MLTSGLYHIGTMYITVYILYIYTVASVLYIYTHTQLYPLYVLLYLCLHYILLYLHYMYYHIVDNTHTYVIISALYIMVPGCFNHMAVLIGRC